MSIQWPNLGLFGEFTECESGILTKINKNFEVLDVITQASVLGFVADEASLPLAPDQGDRYITSDTNNIWYYTTEWVELTAAEGFLAYDSSADNLLIYDGTTWNPLSVNAANLGAGEGIFAQINGTTGAIELKSIVAGGGIVVTSGPDTVTITNSNSSFVVDPYQVQLSNPQFEPDLSSWTFDADVSDNVVSRSTTDPLSGNASALITVPETNIPSGSPSVTTFETQVTLDGGVQVGEKLILEFDYQINGTQPTLTNYRADLKIELREVTGNVLVSDFLFTRVGPTIGGDFFNLFYNVPVHIIFETLAISTESNYKIVFVLSEINIS